MYLINIIKKSLAKTTPKCNLNGNYSLVQDNNPKHNARVVKEWLLYNVQNILPSPNPIEYLWACVEKQL